MVKLSEERFKEALGKALYEAYSKYAQERGLPAWDALKAHIRDAWKAAAGASLVFQPESTAAETDFRQVHFETHRDLMEIENAAIATEPHDYTEAMKRLQYLPTVRLLHAAMGLATESGELLDILKKHIYYGKPVDNIHVLEEIGDVSWYARVGADATASTFLEAMLLNVRKLKARYGKKFTERAALNRNLEQERDVLEGKV